MSHLRCYLLVCFLQGLYSDFFRRTAAMFWFSLLAISVQPEEEEKTKEKKKIFQRIFPPSVMAVPKSHRFIAPVPWEGSLCTGLKLCHDSPTVENMEN